IAEQPARPASLSTPAPVIPPPTTTTSTNGALARQAAMVLRRASADQCFISVSRQRFWQQAIGGIGQQCARIEQTGWIEVLHDCSDGVHRDLTLLGRKIWCMILADAMLMTDGT